MGCTDCFDLFNVVFADEIVDSAEEIVQQGHQILWFLFGAQFRESNDIRKKYLLFIK